MRVQVAGRQMDVGEALRGRITQELTDQISRIFNRPREAVVTVERNGAGVEVDCTLHLDSGITLQSQGHGEDAHTAFSDSLTKLEKRVRRYKRRLRNHHADHKSPLPAEVASAYVLAPLNDEDETLPSADDAAAASVTAEPESGGPLIIAETTVSVPTMTVSMAVMQLDLADAPAFLFRNAGNRRLNVVYRRQDGNVGWIDPAPAA
ncbi:MAG: ribosome-associated translation inhibitor RaiA [Alphaproteobacteria bacterium]|nr:ribosome-associated translation inhibitor RaiA [Alphaproteobacteria bacterium]